MKENLKTEMSDTTLRRDATFSLNYICSSQIFFDNRRPSTKKSLYLRTSQNQVRLPHFQTQIIQRNTQFIKAEKNNTIISGKTYITKAMEHQYLRISCENLIAPFGCQVYCTCEFQLMISQVHPFPTNYNCEQVINNRGFVVSVITGEFIYLSIITRKDSELQFNLQINQPLEECQRIKTLQDTPSTDFQQMVKFSHSKSFQCIINSNKEQAGIKKNRYQDEISRQDRFLKVLSTRNFQRQSKTQAKIQKQYQIKAKKLANQEKIITKIINDKKSQKGIFEQQWAIIIYFIKMSSRIFDAFWHKKQILKKNRLVAFRIKSLFRQMKKKIICPKGEFLETRVLVDCFISIKAKTKIIRRSIRTKQIQVLLPILQQRAIIYCIKMKMLKLGNKLNIIKKHILQFEENYTKYKNDMIVKWDNLNEKIKDEEIKWKQATLRKKGLVTWFQVLKDKEFAQQMRKCFIFELMRDRIRQHLQDQQLIKKYKMDLKYYKQKLRVCRDFVEANTFRGEISRLTNDIYAMHMKNQLFMHVDVEKYFHSLVSKYIILVDEPDNLPAELQSQQKQKQRQSRLTMRRITKKSKF
ncbi:unnamed protein product (macronuclear) [Paramecium tetraurelia]|uniref:IQ calmodulin-binding motif family protein n=1 Tax=Paramecium tetraurelia TaxID=5888 RepID=A0DE33_PARTE|nr:uncharacterized protein GSPATT00016142001 [Paramecium tetraurelia]CAK81300.1 unnamed protein product [Paramecium tetraurelia]|eukprot:XP_001448697.1 hypothetical protein (macronuclear) [Paramecium tetraurelia strain d4-2]